MEEGSEVSKILSFGISGSEIQALWNLRLLFAA